MHRLQAFLSFLIPAIHVSAAKNCPPGYMPIPGAQPGGIGCEAFACFEGEKTYYDKVFISGINFSTINFLFIDEIVYWQKCLLR